MGDYKTELQAALAKGLSKGVLEAVSACKIQAPDIAAGLATAGIRVGRMGYVEPIIMQPTCSLCHGVNIAPDVMAKIATLYPEDQAVGFRVGELRGVFWAEYPATN